MRGHAVDIIDSYFTCELTTFARDGSPIAWPIAARRTDDGRFFTTTSIGMPQKAFNIRRNPHVSLLFSDPTGSGVSHPGAVLIQGDATADDRIVTDLGSDPDLSALMEVVTVRQPSSAFMSSRAGKRIFWAYYMRILIYVTPRRALYWPNRDFTCTPEELDLSELRRVD